MSLLLVPNATTTPGNDANFSALVTLNAKTLLGAGGSVSIFRLTNWDSGSSRPLVAQGALIDVDGSLYLADSDTAIVDEGGLSDGIVYLQMIVAGGGASVTPTFTNTAPPAYNAEKIGWYTGTTRWTGHFTNKSAANFTLKAEYADQNKSEYRLAGGGVNVDGGITASGPLSMGGGGAFGGAVSVAGAVTGVTDLTASGTVTAGAVLSGTSTLKWVRYSGTLDASGNDTITLTGFNNTNVCGVTASITSIAGASGKAMLDDAIFTFSNGIQIQFNNAALSGESYRAVVFYI